MAGFYPGQDSQTHASAWVFRPTRKCLTHTYLEKQRWTQHVAAIGTLPMACLAGFIRFTGTKIAPM